MIIQLKNTLNESQAQQLAEENKAFCIKEENNFVLIKKKAK